MQGGLAQSCPYPAPYWHAHVGQVPLLARIRVLKPYAAGG